MTRFLRALLVGLAAVCTYSDAAAQLQSGLSEETQISLLTVLPGNDIYSLWGHSAIRVYDPLSGVDLSYNYGTFNFEDEGFVLKFMYGNLLYRLARHDFDLAMEHYREVEHRSVIEQVLRLSPAQRDSLVQFLEVNYRPENRFYTYDFLYDNCSTRIRDALERALGSELRFADRPDPEETFRQLLDPYQSQWPFLDAGIDWLLGAPVDRIAQPYETMFLPDYLMEAFEYATVDLDGEWQPLVASTDTLFWIEGQELETDRFPWEALVGWGLFALGLFLTFGPAKRGGLAVRLFDGVLFTIIGIGGILIVFLWFISLHAVTENNWHLLWTWPTHIVAGIALMRPREHAPVWLRRYGLVAAAMTLIAVIGSPMWPQDFGAVHYPLMLLFALRSAWIFMHPRRLLGMHRRADTVRMP